MNADFARSGPAGSIRPVTAVVLAGRRGNGDPLARACGAPHRALLSVQGQPMLERVIETLHASPWVRRAIVSIDRPELLDRVSGLASRIEDGFLRVLPSAGSPSRSAIEAFGRIPPDERVLLTTADHALLDSAMLEHFLRRADDSSADLAVGLVSASILRARFPESRRTYIPLRGESYSGANLFAFRTLRARDAAVFWRRVERFRKRPWRMASAFGPVALLLFALRRLDLADAFSRVSCAIGVRVVAVEMPCAEAAIDVDKPSDLLLVNQILSGEPPERGCQAMGGGREIDSNHRERSSTGTKRPQEES